MRARVGLIGRERFIVADAKIFMQMNLRAGRGKYLIDVKKAITVLQMAARSLVGRPPNEVPVVRELASSIRSIYAGIACRIELPLSCFCVRRDPRAT
jgi:hypothetical protein